MSHTLYDAQWRRSLSELRELLKADSPEASKTLPAWAAVYLRYVRLLRDLDETHDQLAQPQKRELCRAALEACAVRVRELRAWLRAAAGGEPGTAAMADAMSSLRLSTDTALLAPPRAFAAPREAELEARCAALRAAAAQRPASSSQAGLLRGSDDEGGADPDEELDETEPDVADAEGDDAGDADGGNDDNDDESGPLAPLNEAEAAVRLQAGARGLLARRVAASERAAEDALLGLSLKARAGEAGDTAADVAARAGAIAAARRALAAEFAAEFSAAREPAADALAAREAAALKERYREALLSWVMSHRDPATGAYPELPGEAQGGVAAALAPPPPPAEDEKGAKKGGAKGAPAAKPAAAAKPGAKGGPPPGPTPPARSAAAAAMEATVAAFAADWEPRDDAASGANPEQRFDLGALEGALRPAMEASVAAAAAEEVTALVATMRAAAATARAAAGTDAKAAKGGKDGDKGGNATKKAAPGGGATLKKTGGATKGAKGPKDPTADVPMEELQAELAAIGVLRTDPPSAAPRWADIVAPPPLVAAPPAGAPSAAPVDPNAKPAAKGGKGAPPPVAAAPPVAPPPPSGGVSLLLEALTEHVVLPLGCAPPAEDASPMPPPPPRALLLSGAPGAGKALLASAAAAAAGAAVFDLSPLRTDALGGAYAGKAPGTLLVHKVFKVAKAMAPAVVIVNEAERLLTADKRYIAGGAEPYNRLKRDILKEAAALAPRDRVQLLLLTSDVVAVAGKDPSAVGAALDVVLHLPPPDDAARRRLWPAMARRAGVPEAQMPPDWAAVAKLSDGLTPGGMLTAIRAARDAAPDKPLSAAALLDAVAAAGPRPGAEAAEAPRREAVAALQAAAVAAAAAGGAPPPKGKGK